LIHTPYMQLEYYTLIDILDYVKRINPFVNAYITHIMMLT